MGVDELAAAQLSRVPISWVKHRADSLNNPCMAQLVSFAGLEGYGRYWRLVELLADSPLHCIPTKEEQGYKSFMLGMQFTDVEEFECFVSTLLDLDLARLDQYGRRVIPLVESAALDVGMSRLNGSKGGRTAATNRKRK